MRQRTGNRHVLGNSSPGSSSAFSKINLPESVRLDFLFRSYHMPAFSPILTVAPQDRHVDPSMPSDIRISLSIADADGDSGLFYHFKNHPLFVRRPCL